MFCLSRLVNVLLLLSFTHVREEIRIYVTVTYDLCHNKQIILYTTLSHQLNHAEIRTQHAEQNEKHSQDLVARPT